MVLLLWVGIKSMDGVCYSEGPEFPTTSLFTYGRGLERVPHIAQARGRRCMSPSMDAVRKEYAHQIKSMRRLPGLNL